VPHLWGVVRLNLVVNYMLDIIVLHLCGMVGAAQFGCNFYAGHKLCRTSGGGWCSMVWFKLCARYKLCRTFGGWLVWDIVVVNYVLVINCAAPLGGGWCGSIWLEFLCWA